MNKSLLILSLAYLVFALPLSFKDPRKFRISLPFLAFGALAIIFCRFFVLSQPFLPYFKNLAVALASAFLIYFCTRVLTAGGLGFGDVFFGMFSALYTGFYMNIIATVFAACCIICSWRLFRISKKSSISTGLCSQFRSYLLSRPEACFLCCCFG